MRYQVSSKEVLLSCLAKIEPEASKKTLRQWLKDERVTVDGQLVKVASIEMEPGQLIDVGPKMQKRVSPQLPIVYEDKHLVIVNKPAGLLSVATDFGDDSVTAHGLLKEAFWPGRVYIVHRIDRDTSGLLMFARSKDALTALKEMLRTHSIDRRYSAVTEGVPGESSGTWECQLAENSSCRVYRSTENQGQKSTTHYEIVSNNAKYAELEIRLETGRKNQIRVHCLEAGNPIVGDKKYGSTKNPLRRLCLHAFRLEFEHPITGKNMVFEAEIPSSFTRLTT